MRRKRGAQNLTSFRIPRAWIQEIDAMVKKGSFKSRSDAARRAIDRLEEKYLKNSPSHNSKTPGEVIVKVPRDQVERIRRACSRGQMGPYTSADIAIRSELFAIIEESRGKI